MWAHLSSISFYSTTFSLCGTWSLSCVWLFVTPWAIAHLAPLSMGILQARLLEWVAFPFSRGSSQPRDPTRFPTLQADSFPAEPPGKPKNTGVSSHSFLQRIFPTQELNLGLLHCRWILYQLSYQGSPTFNLAHFNFILFLFLNLIFYVPLYFQYIPFSFVLLSMWPSFFDFFIVSQLLLLFFFNLLLSFNILLNLGKFSMSHCFTESMTSLTS